MSRIELVRNDTLNSAVVTWTWQDSAGSPIDITGYTAKLIIKTDDGVELLNVTTAGSAGNRLQILTGTDGVIQPDVSAANMGLTPGQHRYDLELTSPAGVVTTIVNRGQCWIREDLG